MEKEIVIDENYRTTKVFDEMRVGDVVKVPYSDSRHSGIKSEAARRNKVARLTKKMKGKIDLMYRVSKEEHPGFSSIIRLK